MREMFNTQFDADGCAASQSGRCVGAAMRDIDGSEVDVGDIVRVLSIDEDFLKHCLTDDERPHHEAMLNNEYVIDEIVEGGLKASVSIQWECTEGIAIGGLYMRPSEFRLVKRGSRERT
jgi:hypothetical protein